jgi:hypothetical protein
MGFASTYIENRTLFPKFINEAPDSNTGIIVIVPSYGETDIVRLLNSLVSATRPECKVEVIVVINAPGNASSESLQKNIKTLEDIESWNQQDQNCWFRLFSLDIKPGAIAGWGVGLARKTGMDEAVRRFSLIEKPDGIILNLDADCKVEQNYFSAIFREFSNRKERKACSIYFEHELEGNEFHESIYSFITLYELHLRYYYQGLKYSGFPFVFHTVGSAMAVRALEYVSAGGMNRRQAGEDFYLIQKLVPSGGYFSLNSTTVYPSPRPSFRVPFGTGASIAKLSEDKIPTFLTYSLSGFEELRTFFGMTDLIYKCSRNELYSLYSTLPDGIVRFISRDEWIDKITEIQVNTSGLTSFRKRFFGWFNMFRIVRYLNIVHQENFCKIPVETAANDLLLKIGQNPVPGEARDILIHYRGMEKNI